MHPEERLRAALNEAPRIAAHGPWYRYLDSAALQGPPPGAPAGAPPTPLWAGGPLRLGGRFTPPGAFEALYLATDTITAQLEAEALFLDSMGMPVPVLIPPMTGYSTHGIIVDVLDLTDRAIQANLGTSLQELTGNWEISQTRGEVAPTQLLGRVAYESARFSGLLAVSAKNPAAGRVLVVFPGRLAEPSHIEMYDPSGRLAQRLP